MSILGNAVAGSGGIVFGVVQKLDEQHQIIPEYHIDKAEILSEMKRFDCAVHHACEGLKQEMQLLEKHQHAEDLMPILHSHLVMLQDPELQAGTKLRIQEKSVNVEWALKKCLSGFIQAFEHMDDVYLKSRKADVEQVGKRILNCLAETNHPEVHAQSIMIAADFSPSDVVSMWRAGVTGFVATQGGKDSHAMIIARGVGLPGLVGAQQLYAQAEDGDELILDAEQAQWVLKPSAEERGLYQKERRVLEAKQQDLQAYARLPSRSKDGVALPLLANIEFVEEVDIALSHGVDGIGLFRTEFLFMQSNILPTEDEQKDYYQAIVRKMKNKPVTIRLLDAGADKLAHVQSLFGDYDGENPALGLRGVRMLLRKPEILRAQLRAILRCSQEAELSILVPMVVSVAEMQAVRSILDEERRALDLDVSIPLGCMIEVPAAALIANELAKHSDFFSIGSNDLMQYGLAVDRADEHVGYLYDTSHPAIKALIEMAVYAASQQNIPVTVCGELAAETVWTQDFLNMQVSGLSMTSRHVLSVRKHLKKLTVQT